MTADRLPALLLGLILVFYWARVVKLVLKARRRTGRDDANFVPREPLGRVLRTIWYPVVASWVVVPLFSAMSTSPPWPLRVLYDAPVVSWLAAGVAFGALSATMVCWRRMGTSWRMGIDPTSKTRLVVTGPYAYVRHPIYGLSTLLMLASVAVVPSPVIIVLAVLHVAFLQWEARREEQYLLGLHGEEYAAYFRRTGRFVPVSATPYVPSQPGP